jgi:hypothetical protein
VGGGRMREVIPGGSLTDQTGGYLTVLANGGRV